MFEQVEPNSKRWFNLENLKNEIWKDVIGFENLYQISNYGRLKSLGNNNSKSHRKVIIRKTFPNSKNYLSCVIYNNSRKIQARLHRLVALAFIPNVENKEQVNHIDGNKHNNRIDNLECVTNSENQLHAYKNGLEKPSLQKRVKQFDLKGNYIQTFEYITEVERKLKINASSISSVCKGKRKTAGGYIWKYADDNN